MDETSIKDKLIEYLKHNELKYVDRGDKISHCCINFEEHPEENPSSFTVLTEGKEYSHCSSCGFHLNTENLYNFLNVGFDVDIMFLNQVKNLLKQASKGKEKDKVPVFLPLKEGQFEKEYRSISAETFKKVGAFFAPKETFYGRRIIIPIHDVDNNLCSFEAISTNSEIQPKVLRPKYVLTDKVFGFENFIKGDTVFICEGIFNALSFMEIGYNGIFNFGIGSIKEKVRTLLLKGVKNVVLCGDYDEAGKKFNVANYHLLKHHFNVIYFSYPYGSPDKFDINDLHKLKGKENFKEYVDNILIKNMIKI